MALREAWRAVRDALEGKPTRLCGDLEHIGMILNGLAAIAARVLAEDIAACEGWDRDDPECFTGALALCEEEIARHEMTMLDQGVTPPACCPEH